MPQPRRTAWALIASLLATISFAAGSGVALGAKQSPQVADPAIVCSPGQMPTAVTFHDELHPPQTVRVLRSKGPNAGHVETPNFRDYVAVVLRAEYSTGMDKPPLWMRVGAITVKEYAWFKALFWQGGRVSHTDPTTGVTTTECFDVKDTTADQIYKPDQGAGYPGNIPTPANYKAIDETWNITIRKWMADKSKSRLFLTGYRSGLQKPCGADSTGFKIFQKSLRDCGVKNMTLEETLRKYFEPNLQIVDTRTQDVLADSGSWFGDFAVLSEDGGGNTAWRLYEGTATGFNAAQVGGFGSVTFSSIKSQGRGDVDGDRRADLVMLTDNGSKLRMAKAAGNSSGYAAPVSTDLASVANSILVADFNGDMLADVGLLRGSGGQATLGVMLGQASGNFGPETGWWSGALDLGQDEVMAGDVNGDGKADMIVRNSTTGAYLAATTVASCLNLSAWGTCPQVGAVGLGALTSWLNTTLASDARSVVSDFDRDGRDDVLVVTRNNANGEMNVVALKATLGGGFADPVQLWHGGSIASMSDVLAAGMNVNADGLGDLALLMKDGTGSQVMWLKSVERSTVPASMTSTSMVPDSGLNWSTKPRLN